jgi:copper ion binding protein
MPGPDERERTMAEQQEITLSVPDISCDHCVHTINTTLGHLSGVDSVQTDLPTKTVHLRYQPEQVSLQQIEASLDDAGYTIAK